MISKLRVSLIGLILYEFLIVTWHYYVNHWDPKYQNPYVPEFYQMMADVDTLFDSHHIPYSLYSGSLLGALRHKGFIPWDDDLDIMVDEQYEFEILALARQFKQKGYQLLYSPFGYKLQKGQLWHLFKRKIPIHYISMDIFLSEDVAGIRQFASPQARNLWPEEYLGLKEAYPLKTYQFGHLSLTGPNDPTPYLARSYGANWRQVAWKAGHYGNALTHKIEWPLSIEP